MRVLDPNSPEVEVGIRRLNSARVTFPAAPTEIELHFGLHGSAEHLAENFGETLRGADIFALEQVGWARRTQELTQRLAEGDETARDTLSHDIRHATQKEFWQQMHRAIFGAHVIIHNPDVPQGHALAVNYKRATDEAMLVTALLLNGEKAREIIPDEVIKGIAQRLFSLYNKREAYILKHFFPKEIPPTDKLRVVGFFGIMHRGLAVALCKQAAKAGRDDVSVSINETTGSPPEAYEDFLQQRPVGVDKLVDFLTHRMVDSSDS